MTIQVQVKNCESGSGRTVRVTEVGHRKDGGRDERRSICDLQPGESRSFYIHLLMDLIVEEREP
jgi:hypothetical protein